jgi:peptidoglycan biosynthesis protein MviN/MurJ (putative lipid II flippase)
MLLLGLTVAALTLIAAPTAAALMASAENWQTRELTSTLSQEMAPLAFLTVATAYFSVRLQALQRFAYSITEAVPALAIALFVLLPGELSGSTRLAFGTLIGFLLQALLLGGLTQSEDVSVGGFKVRHRSAEWRPLYRSALLMFAGQIMIALTLPIDQAFAARHSQGSAREPWRALDMPTGSSFSLRALAASFSRAHFFRYFRQLSRPAIASSPPATPANGPGC